MNRNCIFKVESSFVNINYQINYMKEFLSTDIVDMEKFLREFYFNIDDFNYELFEFEIGLRALRDKLNDTEY